MDAQSTLDEILTANAFKHTNSKTNVEEIYNFDDYEIKKIKDI